MRLSRILLVAVAMARLESGNAVSDRSEVIPSRTIGRALRFSASIEGTTHRVHDEERGLFDFFKRRSFKTNMKAAYLYNAKVYDDILAKSGDYTAFGAWKQMKYSEKEISRAMKKLGKNPGEIETVLATFRLMAKAKLK
ncbi:secreted RxLR effector peptide protein, putative [Phytophthora infestans T30-4]|uniref:RxLR effector protein n=2 Tax=Phytophthora infestans TaxID=4787 RepID=D0NKF9_PHYIT|nr:secreted RxLR effector peptide protein, putative [Phytophthora infestans T30-4]EEY60095.1 secreted RxLR effector peptide protein, putative [Phytophthora infestans T30-4]KAF4042848.1 hypothetical protein GN244_ATG04865 [Phytophthora infestans]KAF4127782.1 hypothetical protein GN958_ATG23013 [Phytophthora infestans]|eukprot:XP_002900302.1 secreted RxLR effector peptide protein, putative [Phytophthora infestans T30-4]